MKRVTNNFINARLQSIPPHVVKTIILSEHKLDGTLLNEYDISTYLKGGLPLIDKNVKQELNKFVVGEATLKFHDPDKYLNDIIEQSNRKFGLKILLNFEDLPVELSSYGYYDDEVGEIRGICRFGNYIIAIDYSADNAKSGLRAFTKSGSTFTQITFKNLPSYRGWRVRTYGEFIFGCHGIHGLRAYTFIDNVFTQVGYKSTSGAVKDIDYDEDRDIFFIADSDKGLYACTFDGSTFTELGRIDPGSHALGVWVDEDGYVFLADDANGIYVYTFDGSTFTQVAHDDPGDCSYEKVKGDNNGNVFVANDTLGEEHGLIAYTWTKETETLTKKDNYFLGGNARDVDIYGDYIGVAFGGIGIGLFTFDGEDITLIDQRNEDDEGNCGAILMGEEILAGYAMFVNSGLFSYLHEQQDIVLFDGMVDIQRVSRFGRNTLALTAQTWEKEFEHHNAELVHNANGVYFRFVTGVEFISLTGGTTGAKNLNYTYKTIIEDDNTIEEFGLSYEGGEEFLFREADTYSLVGSSGQIITLTIDDIDLLPKKDAEDVLVVSSTIDGGAVGFWYESKTLSELVNLLLDVTNFEIPDDNREINIDISALLSITWQFNYIHESEILSADINCCVEDNPPDSNSILIALGTYVWRVSYDPTAAIKISGSLLLVVTDTFASATRVEKILRLPNGNALVVCTSGTKEAGENGWGDLEGIMEIENDGTIDDTWNEAFLKKTSTNDTVTSIAGTSVELMNYTRDTGEVEDRNGFYWVQYWLHNILGTSTRSFYVSFVDIDDDPSSLAGTTEIYGAATATDCWVAPNVVYHRYWNGTPTGSDYHCWFLMANNLGGYIERVETGSGDVEEALTYCTETTINTVRAIRADASHRKFYLITSKMASDKQYVLKAIAAGPGSTSINTDPVDYFLDHAAFLPNILKPSAFEMDGSGKAQNLVELQWGTGTDNPTIENLGIGFNGFTYSPHPVCYLVNDECYFGVAEMGSLSIAKFFVCTNITDAIIQVADFTGMNVRQALNELASGFNCVWKRMERDTARFVSEGTYCDISELDNNLYKSNWIESKTKPYVGVEIKNPLYPQYEYRYPDSFNAEEGEVLKLENRFAMPINGPLLAKINGDWFMAIRTEVEVDGFFLIELEEFDLIQWKKYLYDGTPDEQVDCVMMGISYDDKTKLTRIRMVGVDSYPFKKVRFRPHYFASMGS